MNSKLFLSIIFLCPFFMNFAATEKSPRAAQKSPRVAQKGFRPASLSPRAARVKMVEKYSYFITESKKGNHHAAMVALIDLNADYHDVYSKLSQFEKLRFKRQYFKQLNGLTLNKWVTKHFTTTLDNIMKLKSICETCEHCGFMARGVQASLSVRRTQANSTSASASRKASDVESKKQEEESSPIMVNGEPLTFERAKRILITMGRERTEFEKRLAEQQATILKQEQAIENQTLKMQRLRSSLSEQEKESSVDASDLSAAVSSDKQDKALNKSDSAENEKRPLSVAVVQNTSVSTESSALPSLDVRPSVNEGGGRVGSSSSNIDSSHVRKLSLVSALTPAQKATKSPVRKFQRVSFGTKIEEGSFYKDTEPNTPIISTRVSIPGKSSIKQLNLQRVVQAVMAAKKAGVVIDPERPLVRTRSFFPPSPASAEIHLLMPPGPADADEIPVPPQRRESSPPPPPAGTPPATPKFVAQQQSNEIPPPPESTPPSSLIAPESPSTIRRNTIAKSLNLSMFVSGVDLPPDPDAGV